MNHPEHGFDVGARRSTGQESKRRAGYCECCTLPFLSKPGDKFREYCDECREHYPIYGENQERKEARLMGDRARVQAMYEEMRVLLSRNEIELRTQREKVAAALRSRDYWKRKVDRIQEFHYPRPNGECICKTKGCRVMRLVGDIDATVRPRFDDWE